MLGRPTRGQPSASERNRTPHRKGAENYFAILLIRHSNSQNDITRYPNACLLSLDCLLSYRGAGVEYLGYEVGGGWGVVRFLR